MADIAKFVDKKYEGDEFSALAEVPVDALEGVSEDDAEHLKAAFTIKTVRDLATNRFVLRAQAITHLAGWTATAAGVAPDTAGPPNRVTCLLGGGA